MSSTYRIHGTRYIRKYRAEDRSSIYSYMSDVRKIANSLCNIPWTRVSRDIEATTTVHTAEGLNWNEIERERFDAAEWCGEHSDGFHRAFGQAACYVFALPDSAVGTPIEKLGIQVTSDPYNPYGARISAMTSATLDIPMDCATVREGEVYRAPDEDGLGAAPRLFMRNADGTQTWYANTEKVTLEPETPLTAKKYLFVFCCLENYNRGRDGWIEGSSYIDNDIELTLSAAASDLIENELNDLTPAQELSEFNVCRGGVLPPLADEVSGVQAVEVGVDGNGTDATHAIEEVFGEKSCIGLRTAYGMLYAGQMNQIGATEYGLGDGVRPGVAFSVALRKPSGDPIVNYSSFGLVGGSGSPVRSFAFGNGVVVAGSGANDYSGGNVYYSRDNGVNWTEADGFFGFCDALAFGDGVFVAGKHYGGLWRSVDNGATWSVSGKDSGSFGSIVFGNGVFVANGADNGSLVVSKDGGSTWTTVFSYGVNLKSIVFSNGIFVIYKNGSRFVSTDGESWIGTGGNFPSFMAMCAGNGVIVASVMNSGLLYSKDNGNTWHQSSYTGSSGISGIAYGNGVFCAGIFTGSDRGVYYSLDNGETWTQAASITIDYVNSLAYCIGTFFAGLRSGIYAARPTLVDGKTNGVWKIMSSVLFVRTSVPLEFSASKVRLDWSGWKGSATEGSRFNVWMKRGDFSAGYPADLIKNHVVYNAEKDGVGDYELVGVIDAADGSRSATFDLKEPLVGEVATFLLSAFVPMDRINPDGGLSLPRGVSASQDVDQTGKTVSGIETGWRPDITLLG